MDEETELRPCPFCGSGATVIKENGKVWTGMKWGEPSSVSVQHWCEATTGQPSRMLERVGRDEASAIAAWNTRATVTRQAAEIACLVEALETVHDYIRAMKGPGHEYTKMIDAALAQHKGDN